MHPSNAFSEFVERQQTLAESGTVDWNAVRDEWLRDLASLYGKIDAFLESYIESSLIRRKLHPVSLFEEDLGEYVADQMEIYIGKQRVSLVPIGTLLVGSRGRVEVVGSMGQAQLWLMNQKVQHISDMVKVRVLVTDQDVHSFMSPPSTDSEHIEWAWKIHTNTLRGTFVDLNQDSFTQLIMEVANG